VSLGALRVSVVKAFGRLGSSDPPAPFHLSSRIRVFDMTSLKEMLIKVGEAVPRRPSRSPSWSTTPRQVRNELQYLGEQLSWHGDSTIWKAKLPRGGPMTQPGASSRHTAKNQPPRAARLAPLLNRLRPACGGPLVGLPAPKGEGDEDAQTSSVGSCSPDAGLARAGIPLAARPLLAHRSRLAPGSLSALTKGNSRAGQRLFPSRRRQAASVSLNVSTASITASRLIGLACLPIARRPSRVLNIML